MKKMVAMILLMLLSLMLMQCSQQEVKTIPVDVMKDKIAGGWAGKMIGVTYGYPTEFRARGTTYDEELAWDDGQINNALEQDDMYVQMSFMMTMDEHGMDAPAEKFAESFANAGYPLWCANVTARKNYFDGIMPPMSGHPKYNIWADAIDFQIEADFIGFMCPGLPQTANAFCDKIGHIMNYGDGVYGGMFVCGLYSEAFFEKDIKLIVENALKTIPAESGYAQCIQHTLDLYETYPDDWRAAWQELEERWGDTDISGPLNPFNIDAKLNGAYIVMGLLYGQGDFGKTMEISIRCGQDSDCNPSNAAAVLGIRDGYSSISEEWKGGIPAIADSLFIFTDYSFNKVVDNTLDYALQLIKENGGNVQEGVAEIAVQPPKAPKDLEVSFPDLKASYKSAITDPSWTWKGNWETASFDNFLEMTEITTKTAGEQNAEAIFEFTGTGVLLQGAWNKDHGKADIYIDGELDRTIDCYYWLANQEGYPFAYLYHNVTLPEGDHELRLVVTGDKNEKATDSKITINGAIVYEKK